jgi:hypothetical protein
MNELEDDCYLLKMQPSERRAVGIFFLYDNFSNFLSPFEQLISTRTSLTHVRTMQTKSQLLALPS